MSKEVSEINMEVECLFKDKPVSFIKATIRRTKITLFFYKESTIFFIQLGFFMIPPLIKLFTEGPSVLTFFICLVCALLYYPFYKFVIKKYLFADSHEIRSRVEMKLKLIYEYINNGLIVMNEKENKS